MSVVRDKNMCRVCLNINTNNVTSLFINGYAHKLQYTTQLLVTTIQFFLM